jgi:peptidyl-tRNA hydrolase, PTH2 family
VSDGELKTWLIVRGDLPAMTVGKLAVQSGHAFMLLAEVARDRDPETWRRYLANSMPKIAVKVPTASALERACRESETAGIPTVAITDEGRTCFAGPTLTVGAVGPCTRDQLPKFIARLRLLQDPPKKLPVEFLVHRQAWRTAIVAARDANPTPVTARSGRAYWDGEIEAFDLAYAAAGVLVEEQV